MKSLWALEEATVPDLVVALNERRGHDPVTRGTIQVLLNRMEAKAWVKRRKYGRAFLYRARVSEAEGLAEMTGQFREKVFDGSSVGLVQALVRQGELDAETLEGLRQLIDETEAQLRKEGSP